MLEIYVLAYNSLFCVEYQIKTFRSFCKDPYNLVIIDSNCGEHSKNSEEKRLLCERYGVEFITLPNGASCGLNSGSVMLGKKLNYVFHNIVKERKPKYFGFIDQDFFPFKEFSIIDRLEKFGMYGDVAEQEGSKSDGLDHLVNGPWMLHPWLSFYKFDLVKDFNLDFQPCGGFDTGGGNWEIFISKSGLKKEDYWCRDNTIMYFPWYEISSSGPSGYEKEYFSYNGAQIYGQVQIYDGKFVHILNSSKFSNDPVEPKTNWCRGFLDCSMLFGGALDFCKINGFHNNSECSKLNSSI
jgi:hypothetical protein